MLVLGIDPGLRCTGYAVVSAAEHRIFDAGLIRTSPRGALAHRLRELGDGLDELLREFKVGLVAVEDLYAHYKHPRTAILMGHARGVVLLAAARRDVEVVSIGATHVKKALTGNGHAGKAQVQRAIMLTAGLARPPAPPDVADAVAVALAATLSRRGTLRRSETVV